MPDRDLIPSDAAYLRMLLEPLAVCKRYQPKFGHSKGLTLLEFQSLHGADPFYTWLGLDSPLLYAAHRAAGGMTSVYRQIGIGCQRLFQQVLIDTLGLTLAAATWSYEVTKQSGAAQTLSLDSRIVTSGVRSTQQAAVTAWLQEVGQAARVAPVVGQALQGAVFEVRQGYKSKDSKRQNADIANAGAAYAEGYLPVVALLSTQIDDTVAIRYTKARWIILYGTLTGSALTSLYSFSREVLGYDLAAFFQRHVTTFRHEMELVLAALLR
ncbi:MAG: hypothetical protein M3Z04_22595 [Chloroflexota bacterium]|nr:hypothetical protein [Chloroflexota bacterium]